MLQQHGIIKSIAFVALRMGRYSAQENPHDLLLKTSSRCNADRRQNTLRSTSPDAMCNHSNHNNKHKWRERE